MGHVIALEYAGEWRDEYACLRKPPSKSIFIISFDFIVRNARQMIQSARLTVCCEMLASRSPKYELPLILSARKNCNRIAADIIIRYAAYKPDAATAAVAAAATNKLWSSSSKI